MSNTIDEQTTDLSKYDGSNISVLQPWQQDQMNDGDYLAWRKENPRGRIGTPSGTDMEGQNIYEHLSFLKWDLELLEGNQITAEDAIARGRHIIEKVRENLERRDVRREAEEYRRVNCVWRLGYDPVAGDYTAKVPLSDLISQFEHERGGARDDFFGLCPQCFKDGVRRQQHLFCVANLSEAANPFKGIYTVVCHKHQVYWPISYDAWSTGWDLHPDVVRRINNEYLNKLTKVEPEYLPDTKALIAQAEVLI